MGMLETLPLPPVIIVGGGTWLWWMVAEGLEEKITETFAANPQTEYVCEDLSSFERLLLHALCAYNSLNSHSFNFAGKRMIRVENPYATFFRRNPGLCEYLHSRMNLSKAHGC